MTDFADPTDLLNPKIVLERAGIRQRMTVADLGCGATGSFLFTASRLVGGAGTVYAVDIRRPVLTTVHRAAKQHGLQNITPVWANVETPGATHIPRHSIDVVLLINILFQSDKRTAILTEAERMLKPDGRLLVVDWKTLNVPYGPPVDRRVSPETLRRDAQQLGLREITSFDAGPFHFGIVFTLPPIINHGNAQEGANEEKKVRGNSRRG